MTIKSDWHNLTKKEQDMLKNLASTFSEDGKLLSDKLSYMIALEMFMLSWAIIKKREKKS